MKFVLALCCVLILAYCQVATAKPGFIAIMGARRCVNLWDEGCINGQLPGAGNDDDYLNGGFNPGKRCINSWDADCNNAPMNTEGDEFNHRADLPSGRRILYELLEKISRKQLY